MSPNWEWPWVWEAWGYAWSKSERPETQVRSPSQDIYKQDMKNESQLLHIWPVTQPWGISHKGWYIWWETQAPDLKLLFILFPTLPQHMLSLWWYFNGCVKWPMSLDAFGFFSPKSIGMLLFFFRCGLVASQPKIFCLDTDKSQESLMKKSRRLCEFVTGTQTGRFSGPFRLPMLAKIDF